MRRSALITGLVLAAVVAGCGGDDDSTQEARQAAPAATDTAPQGGETAGTTAPETVPGRGAETNGEPPERTEREASPGERETGERPRREPENRRAAPRRSRTRAQVVAAGDRACAAFRRDVAAIDEGGSNRFERIARRTRRVRALTARLARRLGALRPPPARRELLRGYQAAVVSQVPLLGELLAAAEDRDRDGVREAQAKIEVLDSAGNGLARKYGFRVCGQRSSVPPS